MIDEDSFDDFQDIIPPLFTEASPLGGRWVVVRFLGSGANGIVFEGYDKDQPRRKVAVKFLRRIHADSATKKRAFEKEIKRLVDLRHPNIISTYQNGTHSFNMNAGDTRVDVPWFVSDLYENDLRKVLARHVPADDITLFARDICEALQYSHELHFAHRDIKPDNVFVNVRTSRSRAVVGDFGVGTWQPGHGTTDSEPSGNDKPPFRWAGSPGYMAPEVREQVSPSAEALQRMDVFSTGVTLYELAVGKLPFGRPDMDYWGKKDEYFAHVPERLRKPRPDLRPELEALILRMISVDPVKRPTFAEALLELDTIDFLDKERGNASGKFHQKEMVRALRSLVCGKVHRSIEYFVRKEADFFSPVRGSKNQLWDLNVFFRAVHSSTPDHAEPQPHLHLIRSWRYDGGDPTAFQRDWIEEHHRRLAPIHIDHCCSGLAIRLHDQACRDRADTEGLAIDYAPLTAKRSRYLYMAIRDVHSRHLLTEPNMLSNCYARAVDARDGDKRCTWNHGGGPLENVETIMLMPIYDPTAETGEKAILAVLNVEWQARLSKEDLHKIGERMEARIYGEKGFSLSTFIAQVVELATEPEAAARFIP